MDIRKVLAGGLAAITAGATIALGAAAITSLDDYVGDVTAGKLASPTIVIGDSAITTLADAIERTKDVLGAADIAAAVAGYATTTVATGAGAAVAVSGGADVATVDNKLYMDSKLNKAKDTLTATDLPTILAKGTVTVSGYPYEYDQYITFGSSPQVSYGTIAAADILDPIVYLSMPTLTSTPLYNTSIVFNKLLNVSDSHVQGKKLTLFGNDYTIAANSDHDTLILQEYGITETLTRDAPVTVTIGGTPYTVEATYIGSNQLLLKVEGVTSDTLIAGDTDQIGGLNIYVKGIYPATVAGETAMAIVSLGSGKLTLDDGQTVTVGTATTLDGTLVDVIGTSGQGISKISIAVVAEDSTEAYIQAGTGNEFADPVFGSFKVAFNGLTPDLTDASRDTVTVAAGNTQASVAFTDYRGNTKTQYFSRIDSSNNVHLNASATQEIVVIEGEQIDRSDLFLFAPKQKSEFGHILKLSSITGVGTSNPKFTIQDVVTGSSTTYNIASDGTTDIYIDGQLITVTNQTTSVTLEWGIASSNTTFPLIKLENGEYMTFVDNSTTFGSAAGTAGILYELPGNVSANITNDTTSVIAGQITYTFSTSATVATLTGINRTGGSVIVNTFPAILIMQEKDNSTNEDFIGIATNIRDSSYHYIGVAAPGFSDGKSIGSSWSSDTYTTSAVDFFGTYVTRRAPAGAGQTVTVYYPDTQAVATIGIGSAPTFAVGGVGTVEAAVKITQPISKLASEVMGTVTDISTLSPGTDLILIGGPCANALTAAVMAADNVTCGAWTYTTGVIKEYTGAFADGSKALVVAGTDADDTRSLCGQLIAGTLSYAT